MAESKNYYSSVFTSEPGPLSVVQSYLSNRERYANANVVNRQAQEIEEELPNSLEIYNPTPQKILSILKRFPRFSRYNTIKCLNLTILLPNLSLSVFQLLDKYFTNISTMIIKVKGGTENFNNRKMWQEPIQSMINSIMELDIFKRLHTFKLDEGKMNAWTTSLYSISSDSLRHLMVITSCSHHFLEKFPHLTFVKIHSSVSKIYVSVSISETNELQYLHTVNTVHFEDSFHGTELTVLRLENTSEESLLQNWFLPKCRYLEYSVAELDVQVEDFEAEVTEMFENGLSEVEFMRIDMKDDDLTTTLFIEKMNQCPNLSHVEIAIPLDPDVIETLKTLIKKPLKTITLKIHEWDIIEPQTENIEMKRDLDIFLLEIPYKRELRDLYDYAQRFGIQMHFRFEIMNGNNLYYFQKEISVYSEYLKSHFSIMQRLDTC